MCSNRSFPIVGRSEEETPAREDDLEDTDASGFMCGFVGFFQDTERLIANETRNLNDQMLLNGCYGPFGRQLFAMV
ncbi:hypothetical protein NDU88_001900 [Pleurodeles waltl]|uniref:Uncharacterized protein n=1 Tax=Pleurodeles waltl TaxID=8319 RepID=A0AAV7S8P1_PLEWA|nr:hypothetical protein NDU88_001900 [Pleurodeles waltl]